MSATMTGESPRTLKPKPSVGLRWRTTALGADHSLWELKIAIGPCLKNKSMWTVFEIHKNKIYYTITKSELPALDFRISPLDKKN